MVEEIMGFCPQCNKEVIIKFSPSSERIFSCSECLYDNRDLKVYNSVKYTFDPNSDFDKEIQFFRDKYNIEKADMLKLVDSIANRIFKSLQTIIKYK